MVLKLDPNDIETLFNKGNIQMELGNYEEAIKSFNNLLKIDPDDIETLSDKGKALIKIKKISRSFEMH